MLSQAQYKYIRLSDVSLRPENPCLVPYSLYIAHSVTFINSCYDVGIP